MTGPDSDSDLAGGELDQHFSGTADVEYDPFDKLVRLSTGALLGTVTSATTTFNLPPGETYDIRGGDYSFPLIYSEVRIAVLQWYRNEESYHENEVTVITEGGAVPDVLTPAEVDVLESQAPGTFESLLTTVSYSIGDANLVPGDTIALLLNKAEFEFASGAVSVPRVTGGAAGAFVVGDDERLFNAVASVKSDPRLPLRLTEFIDEVAQESG